MFVCCCVVNPRTDRDDRDEERRDRSNKTENDLALDVTTNSGKRDLVNPKTRIKRKSGRPIR